MILVSGLCSAVCRLWAAGCFLASSMCLETLAPGSWRHTPTPLLSQTGYFFERMTTKFIPSLPPTAFPDYVRCAHPGHAHACLWSASCTLQLRSYVHSYTFSTFFPLALNIIFQSFPDCLSSHVLLILYVLITAFQVNSLLFVSFFPTLFPLCLVLGEPQLAPVTADKLPSSDEPDRGEIARQYLEVEQGRIARPIGFQSSGRVIHPPLTKPSYIRIQVNKNSSWFHYCIPYHYQNQNTIAMDTSHHLYSSTGTHMGVVGTFRES